MSLGEVMRNSLLGELHNGIDDDGTASMWICVIWPWVNYIHAEKRSFWDIFGMIVAINKLLRLLRPPYGHYTYIFIIHPDHVSRMVCDSNVPM